MSKRQIFVGFIECTGIGAPGEGVVEVNAAELFKKFCNETDIKVLQESALQIQNYLAKAKLSSRDRATFEEALQNKGFRPQV